MTPASFSKLRFSSMGRGAPPDTPLRSDFRSSGFSSGLLRSALNKVGTPGMTVGRVSRSSFNTMLMSKRGTRISIAALEMPRFMMVVMAKTWKNGRIAMMRSAPFSTCISHKSDCCKLTDKLA